MSKMETTFYEDQNYGKTDVNMLKKRMTLDLNSPGTDKPPLKKQRCNNVSVLSSPDLNMLRLASPELEKLIIQQNHGLVTTTPTPTQFFFPRHATEEQEMYAKGFVDALAELHHTSDSSEDDVLQSGLDNTEPMTSNPGPTYTTLESHVPNSSIPSTNTITVRPFSSISAVTTSVPPAAPYPPVTTGVTTNGTSSSLCVITDNVRIKEEPQIVPNIGLTPPLSPINMESQERIKLERKRLRNRLAASKCRRRKLERIGRLESKVNNLKGENTELANVVNKLRDQRWPKTGRSSRFEGKHDEALGVADVTSRSSPRTEGEKMFS